ncbi:unnamed protein product [Cyclocybe aegerita]|uniref:Serum paraoxonase/arylesterase n=1 Tax=Cyclocybe aegerita TaxID=1973307 RepID=A0A8S0XNT1_CYCAE|nr:unnamed protein product [Cyclocybe aegerita]
MTAQRTLALVVLALGIIFYRSGALIKNCILIRSPLPSGYIAGADYASDCTTLNTLAADPADAPTLNSCEDAVFWELHDVQGKVVERPVILSCDANRKSWNTVMGPMRDPNPRGALWIYVPPTGTGADAHPTKKQAARLLASNVPMNRAHRLDLKGYPAGHDFHPLGLEVWPSRAGEKSNLYVINHARERTVIEQFVLDPKAPTEAVYVRTISSRWFLSPNGLALTGPDAFYVSNDHLMTRRLPIVGHVLPVIESVLGLPLGFVLHVELNTAESSDAIAEVSLAKPFIAFPNGIAISESGKEAAIVSTSLSQITVFERDPATSVLSRKKYVATVPFSPDNIRYTPGLTPNHKEALVVAGHPNFPDLTAVAANKTGASASSWVVAILPKEKDAKPEASFDLEAAVSTNTKITKDGAEWTLKTLFQSHGIESERGFGGSTTGLFDPESKALYVTGLYATGGVLMCRPGSGIGKN